MKKKNRKNKKIKTRKLKSRARKVSRKPVFKSAKTGKVSSASKLSKKARELQTKVSRILTRGKERGFVTYDEILKEFPSIENNIILRINNPLMEVWPSGKALHF